LMLANFAFLPVPKRRSVSGQEKDWIAMHHSIPFTGIRYTVYGIRYTVYGRGLCSTLSESHSSELEEPMAGRQVQTPRPLSCALVQHRSCEALLEARRR